MGDVRVRLKMSGINKVLKSEPVQKLVDRTGERIADAAAAAAPEASGDFEYERKPHKWTSRGFVQTGSARAMRAQKKHAVLERAVAQVRSMS
ncbi:hypothetical protein [Microbacterium halotolerans]|uniref:hypothetical protein n=1 Tax=Microbacterium halotolerans TaxID=246613 RepID=UPI0013C2EBE8|nr:hypothetical protein [Microbacterium halotolerans]